MLQVCLFAHVFISAPRPPTTRLCTQQGHWLCFIHLCIYPMPTAISGTWQVHIKYLLNEWMNNWWSEVNGKDVGHRLCSTDEEELKIAATTGIPGALCQKDMKMDSKQGEDRGSAGCLPLACPSTLLLISPAPAWLSLQEEAILPTAPLYCITHKETEGKFWSCYRLEELIVHICPFHVTGKIYGTSATLSYIQPYPSRMESSQCHSKQTCKMDKDLYSRKFIHSVIRIENNWRWSKCLPLGN